MPDDTFDNLIESIIAKTKNILYSQKNYEDEPILMTAAQLSRPGAFLPPKIKEMRRLSNNYYNSSEKTFYDQGMFMVDYEDDYVYEGHFDRCYPKYQSMTDLQLRGYFTWRANVRRGIIKKTSIGYVFLYSYEAINCIGFDSPEQGFLTLRDFWETYKKFDESLDYYMSRWLSDFVIFYGLDKSLLQIDRNEQLIPIVDLRNHTEQEIRKAICAMASHYTSSSRFCKSYPDDFETALFNTLMRIADMTGSITSFFCKMQSEPYTMFPAAIFTQKSKACDTVYEVSKALKFTCVNGLWSRDSYVIDKQNTKDLTELLRSLDALMREKYNFKTKLKQNDIPPLYLKVISEVLQEMMTRKTEKEKIRIEIDVSKLEDIRLASEKTQEKLIIDEDEYVSEVAVADEMPAESELTSFDNDLTGFDNELTDTEKQLLRCLLNNLPYTDCLRGSGMMLSVIVDSINEKLYDLLGDTALACDSEVPQVVDDYRNELEEIVNK